MNHAGRVTQNEYHAALDRRDKRIAEFEAVLRRIADGAWVHSVGAVSRADYDELASELARRQNWARDAGQGGTADD